MAIAIAILIGRYFCLELNEEKPMISFDIIKKFLFYYLIGLWLVIVIYVITWILAISFSDNFSSIQGKELLEANPLLSVKQVFLISSVALGFAEFALITLGAKLMLEDGDSYSIFMTTAILSLSVATLAFAASLILGQHSFLPRSWV